MISSEGALLFGNFFKNLNESELYISKQFTNVKKVVCQDKYYYLLCNGDIYVNNDICTDNFTKIMVSDIIFINIVPSVWGGKIIALSTNSELCEIKGETIELTNINCKEYDIKNIYGVHTPKLLIKTFSGKYYMKNNGDNNIVAMGKFDSVYYLGQGFLVIADDKVMCYHDGTLSEYNLMSINVDLFREIPEGSFLRFYDNYNTIKTNPNINSVSILYSMPVASNNFSICCETGKIYNTYTGNEIPKLKDCIFETLHTNIYSRTKKCQT
jgi:hypothetical protein